jgi:hypothetical protein
MQRAAGAKVVSDPRQISGQIEEILDEAMAREQTDRRAEVRYPFFCHTNIALRDGRQQQLTAFSREISLAGVGLLHNMPLQRQEVIVTFLREHGGPISLRTEIVWCRPCGEGWYLSGGKFLDARASH